MKPSEQLRAAKDLLSGIQWCQGKGSIRNRQGDLLACCALVALGTVQLRKGWNFYPSESKSGGYLKRIVGGSILGWNDKEGRTKEEILTGFEKAAQAAEADGQ